MNIFFFRNLLISLDIIIIKPGNRIRSLREIRFIIFFKNGVIINSF